VYRPLRARRASNTVLLVASVGVFTVVQAVVAILFSSQFQTLSRSVGAEQTYTILGGVITETQVLILLTSLVIMIALGLILKYSRFGKAVRAVADDEEVAQIVGINTGMITAIIFFIGAAIAGTAGIAVGFDTGIEPTMGMSLLLKGVVSVIIGGVGNMYGVVLGAFLLAFVENTGAWYVSGEWKDAIAFGVLIIFLLFRPQGIWGK
jgi:branched-chain amino acid transport system permease protein